MGKEKRLMATHELHVSEVTINSYGMNTLRISYRENKEEKVSCVLIRDITRGEHFKIAPGDWPAIRNTIDSFFNHSNAIGTKLASYDWEPENADDYMEDDTAF